MPSGHWKAMSESQTLLLGFIAGVTILIGLPLGRVRSVKPGTRQFLNAVAIGILIFLIWDVLVHAFEPVDVALGKLHDGSGGVGPVAGYAALFFLGITVGLGSLVFYEGWLGSIYSEGRYRTRGKHSKKKFEESCLAEYAATGLPPSM